MRQVICSKKKQKPRRSTRATMPLAEVDLVKTAQNYTVFAMKPTKPKVQKPI